MNLFCADNLKTLKSLPDSSIDSVVTDPPYGLKFMGKKWDYDVPSVELWQEVFRVLKPGGHLLSFGGTRTYHRMVVAIEDAGFEIRDQLQWIYGSGFPKSLNVSKAIDKEAGVERTEFVIDKDFLRRNPGKKVDGIDRKKEYSGTEFKEGEDAAKRFLPATISAKQWQGFGTALKPANEPIVLARKPLEKGLTVAQNVLKWGTGAINVDGCRVGSDKIEKGGAGRSVANSVNYYNSLKPTDDKEFVDGRWPANVLLDEDAAEALDEQTQEKNPTSRFFYVAKASKRERGEGNNHPTVKPIKLMRYLCKLITPPKAVVLDPFMGSGSTGVAALLENFDFVGIEIDSNYFEIAEKRIRSENE